MDNACLCLDLEKMMILGKSFLSKVEECFSLMCSKELNKATMSKHMWDICQKSNSSLWVDQIKTCKLKDKSLQEIKATKKSSQNWKKILKMKEFMKSKIKFIIGNYENMLLLKENWHPFGLLLEGFGNHITYDVGLGLNCKVKSIIGGTNQRSTSTNTIHLIDMKSLINFGPTRGKDKVIWLPNQSSAFTINLTWNKIKKRRE